MSKVQKTKKAATPLQSKDKFKIGERVLCYQGPHLYEAKCLKRQVINQQVQFLVHYSKWKTKYDEWVPQDRILKYNVNNLKLQQELRQKAAPPKLSLNNKVIDKNEKKNKIAKANSSEGFNNPSANASLKKLITPPYICKQKEFLSIQEVKLRIPEDLKTILIDDWELITNQQKLYSLPPQFNIDRILNNYFYNKTQTSKLPLNHSIDGYNNFLSNLRKYFDYLLEKHLLYPMELEQLKYLKDNYDSLTLNLKSEEKVNSQKESRKAWKKYKRSHHKKTATNKLPVASTDEETNNTKISTMISDDQNCPNETSKRTIDEFTTDMDLPQTASHNQSVDVSEVKQESADTEAENKKKIDYTKLYGAIHLLRLFSKLGQFLFYTNLSEERLALLNTYIYDFLKYLSKNLWNFWDPSDASYIDSSIFNMKVSK